MRSDAAISVKNLTKTYRIFGHPGDRIKQALTFGRMRLHREFTALKDVSFEIKKGETVGIIGRNGSGKSTLLQLICGILKPTSGSAEVNGRISALLELGAGFNPEFTGRENVYFQGAVMGFTKAEVDARFSDIVAFADIGDFIDQPVRTYSSGMFVRLAFAVAVSVEPDILVVDEALAVGDVAFQAKCFKRIDSIRNRGGTILLVTHTMDMVVTHCERAILLQQGRIVESGSPKKVIDTYRRLLTTQQKTPISDTSAYTADWADMFEANPAEARYGSRDTEIIEAGLFTVDGHPTQLLQQGDECLVKIRLLSHKEGMQPFVSFVIKDPKGLPLCGTTTLMEGVHLDSIQPDQVLIVTFRFTMLLNTGHYLLSVGSQIIGPDGGVVAHDHRTDYLPFEVLGKPHFGIFAAPIAASYESEP